MSSQDPLNSPATPDRPTNPTHFGGDGLYGPDAERSDTSAPHRELRELRSADAFWGFAKRNHVPALLAVGGLVWLLVALVRRSTERW
jgi:hypothetical protein